MTGMRNYMYYRSVREHVERKAPGRKREKKHKNMRKMEKDKTRNSVQGVLSVSYVLHDIQGDSSKSK